MEGWKDGWMGGWVDGGARLRIAYSNQKNGVQITPNNKTQNYHFAFWLLVNIEDCPFQKNKIKEPKIS